jgi:hypothetical protein
MDEEKGGGEADRLALNDYTDWRRLYPDLRPIEVLHTYHFGRDPLLVLKADCDLECMTFLVAAYSSYDYLEYDRRFYGLALYHDEHRMEWREIGKEHLDWEGPGEMPLVVDAAWRPRRSSVAVRDYPTYTFVPEEERSCHPRYPVVTASNLGELKGSLERARDIPSVALVGAYFDVATAGYRLSVVQLGLGRFDFEGREKGALELAELGLLRVAVKELASVPERWRPYTLAVSELPDAQRCEVAYAGGMYYVRLLGRILPGRSQD